MAERLDWRRDGLDWPHHDASRFVSAGGLRWHVQQMGPAPGEAPTAVLIHGTGASTHSWRGLMPLLAEHLHVVAMDLPGQGFTSMPMPAALSLPGMARAIGALTGKLGLDPALVIGHSAGAAVAARMCLDGLIRPRLLVALNGALLPLSGPAGRLFSPLAKLLVLNPWVPRLVSWRAADPASVRRLINGTGSRLDTAGMALYGRLVRNPGHVAGVLAMMANWDLRSLQADLARLEPLLLLLVASGDRTLPPEQAHRIAGLVPTARLVGLPGLGHLAHEEQPLQVGRIVLRCAAEAGISNALGQPAAALPP